jgi:hypothetical protein
MVRVKGNDHDPFTIKAKITCSHFLTVSIGLPDTDAAQADLNRLLEDPVNLSRHDANYAHNKKKEDGDKGCNSHGFSF